MITFEVKGAIFDVDDTLLDNNPGGGPGLHERSRLAAVHTIGKRHNIRALAEFSAQDNLDAFRNASVHTIDGAVWNIFVMTGLADNEVINNDHPLLKEIVTLKNALHKDILLREGEEVPGAVSFVKSLAGKQHKIKLAIASTAVRSEIDLFLNKTGLNLFFSEKNIFSKESITHPKPHPEVFNLAFDSLQLSEDVRKQVCAFEDDPRGIMAAKAAGLFTCAITTRYSKDALLSLAVPPDLVAESFQEFAEHFGIG